LVGRSPSKNHFYPICPLEGKGEEFLESEKRKVNVLQYASKFMELSCFAAAYIADETLKINQFESN